MEKDDNPTVTIKQGTLKGKVKKSFSGVQYESFTGIPYAKPPLGKLRFKSPEPAEPWEGVYDATKEAKVCCQIDDILTKEYMGEEDCLYLNVHTPKRGKRAFPVLFWIHGGGFTSGFGNEAIYGPDFFIDKDVVVVTINYRLGALGFLCLHTAAVPGNAGMKDQLLALQWVNENISKFGGDPKNITIFGESAGAASVDMLLLSSKAAGLFQKAICQSGSCFSPWAFQDRPLEMAFKLGKLLNFETDDVQKLFDFLQTASAEEMTKALKSPDFLDVSNIPFVPVIEKTYPGAASFLTENPKEILSSGRHNICPTISGFNSNEGAMFVLGIAENKKIELTKLEDIIPDIKYLVPTKIARQLNPEDLQKTAEEIKKLYFSTGDEVENYMDFMSESVFLNQIKKKNELLKKHSDKVYSYNFTYHGDINLCEFLMKKPYKGAAHADDLCYLFKIGLIKEINGRDLAMIDSMTTMWTNFAKYGEPTIKQTQKTPILWPPMTKTTSECLLIDQEMKILSKPYNDRMEYWDKYDD